MEYIILIFTILIVLLITSLIKISKRKKAAAFPDYWHSLLMNHVHFYKQLSFEDQKKFQQRMMVFLSEIYIDTVNTDLTDLDKVLIAASAVIPVFGFDEWHYNNLSGVLLYPDTFNNDLEFDQENTGKNILGLVGTGRFENQMILSKKSLYDGFRNLPDVQNTSVHEFVHLIDKMDSVTDGVPERLLTKPYIIPWLQLIHKEMEAINDNKSDIRSYGGTNEAEFLAVASEYFFEQPKKFEKNHPELYKMLTDCFRTNKK